MNVALRTLFFVALSSTYCSSIEADEPAAQFSALLKEYSSASGGLREAKTDLERKQAVENLGSYAIKFLDFADEFSEDPIAIKSLKQAVQVLNSTDSTALSAWELNKSEYPSGCERELVQRVIDILLRDHVGRKDLGAVVDRARYGYRLEYERFLQTVLEKNSHHEVKAIACISLAQFLNDKIRMRQLIEDRPELVTCCDIVFGKGYAPDLQRLDLATVTSRIEKLFERAAEEFGSVKLRRGTVGEQATAELNELRNLSIGKPAPDTEGRDQDGKQFKLSDYHGKVVLLYFWMEY